MLTQANPHGSVFRLAVVAASVVLTSVAGPASAEVVALQCRSGDQVLRIDVNPAERTVRFTSDEDKAFYRDGVAAPDDGPGCVQFVTVSRAEFVWGLKCDGFTVDTKIDRLTGEYVRRFLGPIYARCTRVSNQPRF